MGFALVGMIVRTPLLLVLLLRSRRLPPPGWIAGSIGSGSGSVSVGLGLDV